MDKPIIMTAIGGKYKPHLPITIDSIVAGSKNQNIGHTVKSQLVKDCWYIAKPLGYPYGRFIRRIYHAWLVLTNKAMAVQYTEDHFRLAKIKMIGE